MSTAKDRQPAEAEPVRRKRSAGRFRKTELARVIKAAQKAGEPFSVHVEPATGKIAAVFGTPGDAAPPPTNTWKKP